jgi:hypothetical protein
LYPRIAGGIRKSKREKDKKAKSGTKPATEKEPCEGT